jgi:WD40 repeat protein
MENFQARKDNILVTTQDNTVNFWDGSTFDRIGALPRKLYFVVWVAFSPDNTKFATVEAETSYMEVWDLASLAGFRTLRLEDDGLQIGFNPSIENELVTVDKSNIHIWNYIDAAVLRTIPNRRQERYSNFIVDAISIISPCRTEAERECSLVRWGYESCLVISRAEFTEDITFVCQSPADHNEIAVGLSTGKLAVWDFSTMSIKYQGQHHKDYVTVLRYHSGGAKLFTGSADGTIVQVDLTNGTVCVMIETGECISDMVLSPTETTMVRIGKCDMVAFDIESSRTIMTFCRENGAAVCWSSQPQFILM